MIKLQTDYLIVGAGAMGMAFTDTLLSETSADFIIVDRHTKPGGHWNLAYPFVQLHQPSSFYGVSSRELSTGKKVAVGLNKGLNHMASGPEVSAYFDDVMQQRFLPSGRVQYFPMAEYKSDGVFETRIAGKQYEVRYKKLVDATQLTVSVPAAHKPSFRVADGVNFMPLNNLPHIQEVPTGYVVIGAGKTGIDACLWLLDKGVDPDNICWVVSRDAWLLPRETTQLTEEFFVATFTNQANQFNAITKATSIENMFERLEACGYFVRLDPSVMPTMFHAATVSHPELECLRQIKNVVRMGHVQAIEADRIILDEGEVETSPTHIHVDCSASLATSIKAIKETPVFEGNVITPQTIRAYMPVFSGSLIAYIEARYNDEAEKNRLCNVVPLPNTPEDFIPMTLQAMMNLYNWSQDKTLRNWINDNRLDGFGKLMAQTDPDDKEKVQVLTRLRENAPKAVNKLMEFSSQLAQTAQ